MLIKCWLCINTYIYLSNDFHDEKQKYPKSFCHCWLYIIILYFIIMSSKPYPTSCLMQHIIYPGIHAFRIITSAEGIRILESCVLLIQGYGIHEAANKSLLASSFVPVLESFCPTSGTYCLDKWLNCAKIQKSFHCPCPLVLNYIIQCFDNILTNIFLLKKLSFTNSW